MARTFRQRFEEAQDRVARLNRSEFGVQRLEGPGSKERLEKIRRQFRRITGAASRQRPIDRTQLGIGLWLIGWATCVGIVAAIVLSQFDERRDLVSNLQHVAAYPNCTAARAVGAAPADMGEPGYWPAHDRDRDGVACEPIPDWVER